MENNCIYLTQKTFNRYLFLTYKKKLTKIYLINYFRGINIPINEEKNNDNISTTNLKLKLKKNNTICNSNCNKRCLRDCYVI